MTLAKGRSGVSDFGLRQIACLVSLIKKLCTVTLENDALCSQSTLPREELQVSLDGRRREGGRGRRGRERLDNATTQDFIQSTQFLRIDCPSSPSTPGSLPKCFWSRPLTKVVSNPTQKSFFTAILGKSQRKQFFFHTRVICALLLLSSHSVEYR